MLPLKDEAIESYKNKRFCHNIKKKFHDVDDSDDDDDHSNKYSNDDDDSNDNDEFYVRMFHGDSAGLDDIDDDGYYDHYGECDARKLHGDAAGLDDIDNYVEEFHGVNKNYERVL